MDLKSFEEQWHVDLMNDRYRFVGEIALEKQVFEFLCKELGKRIFFRGHVKSKDGLALTVLGVNCAYFDYDAESFWKHFFNRLDLVETAPLRDAMGLLFEETLDRYKIYRAKRSGPFRYVGCLLEQSGLTRKSLKQFSLFFSQLVRDYGFEGIQVTSYDNFQNQIPEYTLPGYLSAFLKDYAGWQFLKDVSRNVSQHLRGLLALDDLKRIQGYHPSFWTEMIPLIQEENGGDNKSKAKTSVPIPKLFLDMNYRQLVVRFDRDSVLKKRFQINGQLICKQAFVLGRDLAFLNEIEIEVSLEGNNVSKVKIPSWDPSNHETPWATFDTLGTYIKLVKQLGRYLLLVPFDLSDIPEGIIEGDLGILQFESGDLFKILSVKLSRHSHLDWVNRTTETTSVIDAPTIKFDEGYTLDGACDYSRVFVSKAPKIKIENPEGIYNGEYALILDVGEAPRRIDVERGTTELNINPFMNPPVKGQVKIERISRSAYEDDPVNLPFIVLPEQSTIRWPKGVYASGEQPEIKVFLPVGQVKFNKSAESLSKDTWIVKPGARIVEGELVLPEFTISIASEVRRARLKVIHETEENILLVDELQRGVTLQASGGASLPVLICSIASSGKVTGLGELGIYNGAGKYDFDSHSIRDSCKKICHEISEIGLIFNHGCVPTGTWLVDDRRFHKLLNDCMCERKAIDNIPRKFLSGSLHYFVKAIQEKKDPQGFEMYQRAPRFLKSWIAEYLMCTHVFDGIDIPFLNFVELENDSPLVAEALSWYKAAESGKLMSSRPNWDPVLARWLDKYSYYSAFVDFEEVFHEWVVDVKSGPKFTSKISGLPMGIDLSDAWWRYWNGISLFQVYASAKRCTESVNHQVKILAKILLELCEAKNDGMKCIVYEHFDLSIPLNSFPLHEEDLCLFK